MKKYAIIASVVSLVGIVAANMVASFMWFNQPKVPSMIK